MASEGRPPEDLQEAVAATLRRLRGEVGATGSRPAQRIEPQLSMPVAAPEPAREPDPEPDDESPAAAETYVPEPVAPVPAPSRRREPDLLSAVSQTDIPPIPSSHDQGPVAYEPAEAAEEEYAAPRRHWLRYVAALLVLIAFAVVGWWGYRHFAGRAGSGPVPVIAADQTPEKVPPADQPAAQTQTQQETVYNQISPGSTAQQPEVLLPQPETPSTPPAASATGSGTTTPSTTAPSTGATSTTAPSVPAAPAVPPPPSATGSTATGTTTGNSSGTLTETLLPAETTPSPTAPASGQSATAATTTGQAATGQAAATQTATTAPSAPAVPDTQATTATDQPAAGAAATAPAPANDAPTKAGNYRVQLAALKTEADAKTAWKRLAAKYPDILGALSLHLEKVDLGTKGIYYRVQAGPFTDKNGARDICAKLKPKGQPCLVKP